MPLFSVITPTYQCADKLRATIDSVLAQPGEMFEYLLIDGGSKDETVDCLRSYGGQIRWISEPDAGIYDAMNKGIRMATGRFLYFLGAGDRMQPAVLEAVAAEIGKVSAGSSTVLPTLLYGSVAWSSRKWYYGHRFNRFKLLYSNICHQAVFYEKSLFELLGLYNTGYISLSDWELNIRAFNHPGIRRRYIPLQVAIYEGEGKSVTIDDHAFHKDFPQLARQHYGHFVAAIVRLAFLAAHPRVLFYYEPRRLMRRVFQAALMAKQRL